MSYTSFGEFVRILRIKNHQVMGDMARILDVKIPFLSAVENGKKNVPIGWADKLANNYNLSLEEQKKLNIAIDESKTQYKIQMEGAGINQRRAALQFARSFDNMDDETAQKILSLLNNKVEDK